MGMRRAGPVVSRLEIMEARRQAVALQHSEEAAPVLAGGDTEEDLGVDQGIEHLEGAGKQRLVMLRSGLQGEAGGAVVLDDMERARALGLRPQAGNGDVQLAAAGRAVGRGTISTASWREDVSLSAYSAGVGGALKSNN